MVGEWAEQAFALFLVMHSPPTPPPHKLARSRTARLCWLTLGILSLALGIIGIFLPVMPTVPFVLLAAACFTRGSAKLHHWLYTHPHWGPYIRDWDATRSIPRKARNLALVMMWTSISFSTWLLWNRSWLSLLLPVIALCVTIYLLRLPIRKTPEKPDVSDR